MLILQKLNACFQPIKMLKGTNMGKADYKKISSGSETWMIADLAAKKFLCMSRERKKWMKNRLNRYQRRRSKKGVKDE